METKNVLSRALREVDTVIHLGAGRCHELPDYLADARWRIVLVEACPKAVRALQAQSSRHENVHVVQRAVSGHTGDSTLHIYSLPERSSLRKATGLLDWYPGLRLIEKVPVTAYSAGSVFAEIDSKHSGKICLVIDTPGEELSILEGMARENVLERISSLVLRCPQAPMYEGAASRKVIIEFLDAHGFEVLDEPDESELEPVVTLRLNEWKRENLELQERLASLDADRKGLRQEFALETAKLGDVISKKDSELQALEAEKKRYERGSTRQRKAAAQKRELIRTLKHERGQFQKRLEALHASLQEFAPSLRESHESQIAEECDDLGILTRLKTSLTDARMRAEGLEKECDELRTEVERLKERDKEHAEGLRRHESEHNDLTHRQKLLDMEIARAEGQVSLIRDVLLSDREI